MTRMAVVHRGGDVPAGSRYSIRRGLTAAGFGGLVALGSCPVVMCGLFHLAKLRQALIDRPTMSYPVGYGAVVADGRGVDVGQP